MTVVSGRAELQEGLGFLEDPKVFLGVPMPQSWRWVPEGTVVATRDRFVKIVWSFCS